MKVERLRLRVFGVLRNFSDEDGFWNLELEHPVEIETGDDLKALIGSCYSSRNPSFDPAILEECALADGESILDPSEKLGSCDGLALLPPVCGG
ncbi:MAG: hypothetical protein KGP28_00715 [Bdellovibrionales bacterium]|nr:hypothetical protein [Bdellovibrionales bacterium]